MTERDFTPDDEALLGARGIALAEAARQLVLLRNPPPPLRLVRPCTIGDGIVRIGESDIDPLLALHAEAATEGKVAKFVPASGAATRMFRDLLVHRGSTDPLEAIELRAASGDVDAAALLRFLERIEEFAFDRELIAELSRRGHPGTLRDRERFVEILDALLHESGLAYAGRPKGLLPFHRYPGGSRTPFEEHLVEASALVRDSGGVCRVHFSVSPEERPRFEALLAEVQEPLERDLGVRFAVKFSEQQPSTETLAIDPAGRPFRDASGALVLRPGGHGALLQNLAQSNAPIVQIKNIDNIARDPLQREGIRWTKVMTGLVVRLQREAAAHSQQRPVRVCGVVRNEGEPGGGPFWVEGRDGRTRPQIVESAEIDKKSAEQREIFASATHFNPVDIVCALTDAGGAPFELTTFVDPNAVIVTKKSFEGRDLIALERPGLWNGAMAGWNTVFVEVPTETFTPVKTVLDLLRPEHLA